MLASFQSLLRILSSRLSSLYSTLVSRAGLSITCKLNSKNGSAQSEQVRRIFLIRELDELYVSLEGGSRISTDALNARVRIDPPLSRAPPSHVSSCSIGMPKGSKYGKYVRCDTFAVIRLVLFPRPFALPPFRPSGREVQDVRAMSLEAH